MLEISVLGGVGVRRDGEPVSIPGGKTSELLVRLALDAGIYVRSERLIEDLWAADAVNTRPNTLQSKVTRLRRALADPRVIAGGEGGYRLVVDPLAVDAVAVLRDSADAATLLDAGDHREAAEISAAALARYRGELLPSAGDGDWAKLYRARLDEARMKLIETQFSARLRLGDSGDVIGELEVAIESYRYQEGLWELLITALYRAGRQADALAAYRRVRRLLTEELGLDPGPKLQQLEQQILQQDPSLEPDSARAQTRRTNLPSMGVELVGRDGEITEVCGLLEREWLVEIVGTGGIGKTALAIAVGRRLSESDLAPGGIWLVRLETAATPDDVLDAVVAALNAPSEAALLERLKEPPAILILDNCEHVVEAAAGLAVRLLDAAPGLRLLCTSQTPLDVDGETIVELDALSLASSVDLFALRSRRRDEAAPDEIVTELCRSLDGLPLAIELAAARTKTLSLEDISRRLDDRFSVLSDPTSRRPERRRALRATIGWSYELLFPDDKRGLWALATFAGGAPLAAVETVLEALDVPASAVIDVVSRLVGRSLVIADSDALGTVRYRLLDSIRAFALEAMAEAGQTERAFTAHAAWYAHAAERSTPGVRSADQARHLAFARVERANIDGALAWTAANDPQLAMDIANGFGWAWIVLGDHRGAQRILAALAAAGDGARPAARARALLLAGWIEASTDRLRLAREHVAEATELADAVGDVELQARCSYYLAYVVSHEGNFAHALELTDRADALYRELDRPWDQAANWLFAARAAISAFDRERAVEARDQVERWVREVDDPWLDVRREAMLGELARIELRFDDAVTHIARAAETSGLLGFQQTEAYQLSSLGRAQCQAGDYETGAATIELAIEKAEATGDARMVALARVHLGRVLRALGRRDAARDALEAAANWHRAAGGGEQEALGECLLAALDAEDQVAGAEERLKSILEVARRNDDAPAEVLALDALARIAALTGDVATARRLAELADGRMASASHFISELDRVDAELVRQIR